MAGKKGRSGRPKIPEGAQKQKDGELFYRKNGSWIKIKNNGPENQNDLGAQVENKNSGSPDQPNEQPAGQAENSKFSDNQDNLEKPNRPDAKHDIRDSIQNNNEPGNAQLHTDHQQNKTDNSKIDQAQNLDADFSEMEALLDSAPDPEAETGLEAPEPDFEEAQEDSGGHTISGEMLLRILDFGGRFAGAFILQKYFKKDAITREDLKMTKEEREELQEFADEAAATINFKAAGNPWVSLIVAYAIILAMKIEDV
jgi:hypothetical protein